MRIISWNVNGLRSIHQKGFQRLLDESQANIIGLQETKISLEQIPRGLHPPPGWEVYYFCADRKGYSGTGTFVRNSPVHYWTSLGVPDFDCEGRLQALDFKDFVLFNVYFPNGKGTARDNSRVPFKLAFYAALFQQIQKLRSEGREVIVMGDYNTAHREIDLKNWKSNQKISGFLPEERVVLDKWLSSGMIDTFRHIHGDTEAYTWWSPLAGARERNVGWRIDYIFITNGLLPRLKDAFIWSEIMGSDHCPVGIDLADE